MGYLKVPKRPWTFKAWWWKVLWRGRQSRIEPIRKVFWLISEKVRGVCFCCGASYVYSMEDKGAPNPWTEQGKMSCMACFKDGADRAPMTNHPLFEAWKATKE